MNALILAAAPAGQASRVTVSPHAVLLVGAVIALYVGGLWLKSRVLRGRLSRSLSRSMAHPTRRGQSRALSHPRTLARAGRSRRATRRFRTAALISALIAAAWLFTQLHTHTR
jgi:hypothetical protein